MYSLQKLVFIFIIALFFSCQNDNDLLEEVAHENETPIEETNTPEEDTETTNEIPITSSSLRTYIFGHSLIVHESSSNETTVPHWIGRLANEANRDFLVSGQYGFLPQHVQLPPISQWGFDAVAPAWESKSQPFEEANFNSILLTAANFIQHQPASENYFNHTISPIDATATIFDWVHQQSPEATIYIYENWPDMSGFIAGESFPPSTMEYENYTNYTKEGFHNWWINYHNAIVELRPNLAIKMIPVGPILADLLTDTPLADIEVTTLYEDNAPHGRPTLYFLASLVTYMAMYETKAPENFPIPNTVSPLVRKNYSDTVDLIWDKLENFNDADGNSRIW